MLAPVASVGQRETPVARPWRSASEMRRSGRGATPLAESEPAEQGGRREDPGRPDDNGSIERRAIDSGRVGFSRFDSKSSRRWFATAEPRWQRLDEPFLLFGAFAAPGIDRAAGDRQRSAHDRESHL